MTDEAMTKYNMLMAEAKRWDARDPGYAESLRECAQKLVIDSYTKTSPIK